MRESPHASTGSPRRDVGRGSSPPARPARVRPDADRPMSGTANSYQSFSQPKCRRSGVSPGGSISDEEAEGRASASGIECSFASTSTVASCSSRLLLGGRVGEPVAAERVRHHVGRHDAVDVIHQEERRTEHVARVLHPPDAGDRHVGQFADQSDDVELVVQAIGREHRHVRGARGDAGHPLLLRRLAVLLPLPGQDDGLRRHPVGVDAAFDGHLRGRPAGHDGGQPLRHHRGQGGDVAGGVLEAADVFDSRFVGHGLPFRAITIR